MLAALIYFGAGIGISLVKAANRHRMRAGETQRIAKKEIPVVLLIVALDTVAAVSLMAGLKTVSAESASLLGKFETAATALAARFLFREPIGVRLWIAIPLITVSSIILSVNDIGGLTISVGALLVLLSAISWGFENNCTKRLAVKYPLAVVMIKGFGSGCCALAAALALGETPNSFYAIPIALLLGFLSYGLSIFFYVSAQRTLGASKTGTLYATAPFAGVAASILIFQQPLMASFFAVLPIMLAGTLFAVLDKHRHVHTHEPITHTHTHSHGDSHHDHSHGTTDDKHWHPHRHQMQTHSHDHRADSHHDHAH